ncbi:MAG: HD domain-containing phosphohydrolase [Acidobacteriota bacterium]
MNNQENILCVDDEPNILEAYQRALRKQFGIETATGGLEGLSLLAEKGPFAVVVSDMRMPGMDGVQFLARVREQAPDTVRIMLTGNADLQTAIEAVNEGHIFRFLTKPCPPELLARALTAGVQQYHLIRAERELLEKTLSGSVRILVDILSLVNPTAFSRASRVRGLVRKLTAQLKLEEAWEVEIAAMLSQVGCVTIPEDILARACQGESLSSDDVHLIQACPQIGHDLVVRIPRLEGVAEIIAYQDKLFNGAGLPRDQKQGQEIPIGARILKLALDFDKLQGTGITTAEAFLELKKRRDWYDPNIVEALERTLANEIKYEIRSARVDDLTTDVILADDIVSTKGLLLMTKGQEVTGYLRERLKNFARHGVVKQPIRILVPFRASAAVTAENPPLAARECQQDLTDRPNR